MVFIKTKYNDETYELRELSQLINILATEQTNSNSPDKLNPIIIWDPVQNIKLNSKLGEDALNAESAVSGEFIYVPSEGYEFTELGKQLLKLFFIPTDKSTYNIIQVDRLVNIVD